MILSINFAILTFVKFMPNFLKYFRVDRYENLLMFLEGNKNCRVGTKNNRVGRASGNTGIFLSLNPLQVAQNNPHTGPHTEYRTTEHW